MTYQLAWARRAVPPRLLSARLMGARLLALALAFVSRFANRRFVFAFVFAAVAGAKIVHISSNRSALPGTRAIAWGFSWFAQDIALLVLLRLALGAWRHPGRAIKSLRFSASALTALVVVLVSTICLATVTFLIVAGSEIHWHNAALAGDAAGRALMLSGLVSLLVVVGALCSAAWLLQDVLFTVAGTFADVATMPLLLASRICLAQARRQPPQAPYWLLPQRDAEGADKESDMEQEGAEIKGSPRATSSSLIARAAAAGIMLVQLVLVLARPSDAALTYMSWTPALLPLVELFGDGGVRLGSLSGDGSGSVWESATTLATPMPLPWLPPQSMAGFEDWYEANRTHYSAAADPLKISNLGEQLLPGLRERLRDVPIRHVMVVALETTRKDVFPLKEHGPMMDRVTKSWGKQPIPQAAVDRFRTLTPTARFVTGDLNDSFAGTGDRARGGLNFNDAYTASTFTLKSLPCMLCGVSPLIVDFNVEYLHHIYQPCLPHIFDVFNTLNYTADDSFTAYPWKSAFMQTATFNFNNFADIIKRVGFPEDALIDREYLRSDQAKFGPVTLPDVNYFGFEETPLEDYIRDMFSTAQASNERVFLTHITSTSHHPWALPSDDKSVQLADGSDDLSNYLNTIGWDDRWLERILNILDSEGVANETLIVFIGDHGVPITEDNRLTAPNNPNVDCNHVPLVLSHPMLPPITLDDAVSSIQVVPTILDLLIETGSLSPQARRAAQDLVHNYEGQSLVRPVLKSGGAPGRKQREPANNWQFTGLNPGGVMVGVRDMRYPTWRFVLPTQGNIAWRFSDLATDPREADPIAAFDFDGFVGRVAAEHGEEAAAWVKEAAVVTRWWVEEKMKLWRYGDYKDSK